jgi:hypothetical protein
MGTGLDSTNSCLSTEIRAPARVRSLLLRVIERLMQETT